MSAASSPLTRRRPEHHGAAHSGQVGGVLPQGGLAEPGLARDDQPTVDLIVEEDGQRRCLAIAAHQASPTPHDRTVVV